jgi:RND family efflux transporter MFP subunit
MLRNCECAVDDSRRRRPGLWKRLPVAQGLLSALGLSVGLAVGIVNPALAQTAAPPAVTVSAPLQQEITEWDEFTGQFAAIDYVEIRARVSGYLTEIHFEDGQIVHQGDLLFVIDPRPYEATLASMQAQLGQSEAQVDLATRQLGRSAQLLKQGYEPQSNTDQRISDLKVATAAVEAAKAGIRSAQLNVEFTHITAPLTGRISSHRVSIGNLISGNDSSSATLLTTIVSLDPIYFNFDISEADYLAYQRATAKGNLQNTRENLVPVSLHLTDE